MLLEMAIGDAFAIPYEFVDKPPFPIDLKVYQRHPKYRDLGGGRYTDDTQRAIANARVMIRGHPCCVSSYVEEYLAIYREDKRAGYSKRYGDFLKELSRHSSQEAVVMFNQRIDRTSATNGAIMGALPLGIHDDANEVALMAATQVLATHSHAAIPAAQAIALTAHFLTYEIAPIDELAEFLNHYIEWGVMRAPKWIDGLSGGPAMDARTTWEDVYHVIMTSRSQSDILMRCVEAGGDTDTRAALALGLASLAEDRFDADLPRELYDGLENGPYGADYLKALETELRAPYVG